MKVRSESYFACVSNCSTQGTPPELLVATARDHDRLGIPANSLHTCNCSVDLLGKTIASKIAGILVACAVQGG